jgi:hypothetical protein
MRLSFFVNVFMVWVVSIAFAVQTQADDDIARGLTKPGCCFHHPTTLSYHPEVYNYRHYFNIVGHENDANLLIYRRPIPVMNQSEEILTPMPERPEQTSQAIDAARSSRANKKNIKKF